MKKKSELVILIMICLAVIIESTWAVTKTVSYADSNNKSLPIYSVDQDEKKIALTIDVNWAEDDKLDDILKILKDEDIKATFFVIGSWVNYTPENTEKLKRIHESGNEICNHSYLHPDFAKISESKMIEEIDKTNDVVKQVIGVTPKYFRFPSGSYNSSAVINLKKHGYVPIQWDVDSLDWMSKSADSEYDRVTKKVKSGSIILYHNNGKYSDKSMVRVIRDLKSRGYTFVTIDELVKKVDYYIDNDGRQRAIN